MADPKEYDITIIGGGPGGYVAALRAAQLGAKVALVEKDKLGGTCLNRGCIPTKAMVRSVEALHEAKHAADFGVDLKGFDLNFGRLMARKNEVVATQVAGIERLMKGNKIDVYNGAGKLESPRSVAVNGEKITTKKVVLATGSVPARVPVPGLDLPGVVTSDEILDITKVPASLVVIGGGVIGMEFGSIFNGLGSKVTIVEMLPQILPPVDEEIVRRYGQLLRAQGIEVNISATVKAVEKKGESLEVTYEMAKGQSRIEAEMVLVAVGRSPYTEGLGLADVGVTMNRRAIAVNERLETNLDGVYAIGDAIGGIMLAHVASYEGEIAVENALGASRTVDYRVVPNCIFTAPEMAGVGMTEKEVKEKGITYKASRFPFSALGRAHAMGDTTGIVKLLCEAESGKVLGVHIIGPHATDLIAEGAAVMQMGGTAKDIAHTIHAHPTLPEAMHEAALGQLDGALHVLKI
ncbi:MAG: dihydrolipoyl dehydrogenase [Chloroflexi bacterium]|nr:dihydrolipoyl dehydrogenase [Chloroflexota bacterium]